MPQVSYLVRQQVRKRLADNLTGFNYWLSQACLSQVPQPDPYVIDFADGSSNFWQSNITAEELDATSTPADGTLCLLYSVRSTTPGPTYQKFSIFGGVVQVAVDFEIARLEGFDPSDTEGLPDATVDAMYQTFNSQAYFNSWSSGVIYNGTIEEGPRGPMRQSGSNWRQRIPFLISFELETV